MAGITIRRDENPTIATWACTFAAQNAHLSDVKPQHVVEAAKLREVPVRDGRISGEHAGQLYFGLMDVMGLTHD